MHISESGSIGHFGGYLSAAFPSQLNVDVTEFCNLACIHCPYESAVKPKGKARQQFPANLHAKIVAEIATAGQGICRFVRYTGEGEPLLHPQIFDFLTATKHRANTPTSLTTNGLLLTEERCRLILEADVGVVDISLDAFTPETYAKIRVGGELAEAQGGVLRLLAMARTRNHPLKIAVSFIRQALNAHEAEPFREFWQAQKVDLVFVRNLHSCAGHLQDLAQKMWGALDTNKRTPCLYPWERLLLKPDGAAVYCPNDWHQGTVAGHIQQESIQQIWQGDAMQAVRAAHQQNNFIQHKFCGQCPDWSVIQWPQHGRSYATMMHEFTAGQ
jgi:radical SAM protein with 4Fe4S-binding SPASM domain